MEPTSGAKSRIREVAANIGIDGIGVCDSLPLKQTRMSFEMAVARGYIPPEAAPRKNTLVRLTSPTRHLTGARSVISAYESYYTGESDCTDPTRGAIAGYTRSNYYEDLKRRLKRLAAFMEKDFSCRTKLFSCYVTLAEKPLARKAGLGFYGKNGIIVTPAHGTFVVLGEIITDLALEPDQELDMACGSCNLCVEACPTEAIREPHRIDRRSCIQYLSERPGTIPVKVREIWQNRLYGCTTCQDVCPRNMRLSPTARRVAYGEVGSSISLADVILMSEREFRTRFENNQIGMRQRNAIRRNAIIAAGNSHSEMFTPALLVCMSDPDPMIRQHSLWALARIKGSSSRALIEGAMRSEQEASVRAEIKTLLDGLGSVA